MLTRRGQYQAGARLRAGYTPGGGALFYVTGGGAYAKMKNDFATTNAANSFADTGKSNAWGYSVGGGGEVMVTSKLSLGRSEGRRVGQACVSTCRLGWSRYTYK